MDKKMKETMNMKLAEKIFNERKKIGLSQEQFAEKLEVSRQAVSKWESGQSMPDLDKIIVMSNLFNVSTDYLLKEEQETDNVVKNDVMVNDDENETIYMKEPHDVKVFTDEEAENFLDQRAYAGKRIAIGVVLCIISVVLSQLVDFFGNWVGMPAPLTDGLSGVALLGAIAIAVGLFVTSGLRLEKYEFLEKEDFTITENLKNRLQCELENYHGTFATKITAGVVLCILAVIALMIISSIGETISVKELEDNLGLSVMLSMIAVAVFLFVTAGIKMGSYQILLQVKDYSREKKLEKREGKDVMGAVAAVYWCSATALYLAYSFITNDWGRSWIVWPVAGCLFGGIAAFISISGIGGKKETKEM